MAMQQLGVPAQRGKGRSRLGRRTGGDRRGKSPKSQQKQILLSASMEIPVSSGELVLTQGEGYNPLAWDSMPAAIQKQFPHWKSSSLKAKSFQEDSKNSSTDEHPFLISASLKSQAQPKHGIPYVVMDCDSLNSISLKFDTTPAVLARFNKRTLAGFSIFPGNVVYVPDGDESPPLPIKREEPRKSAPPFLECNSPTPERDAPPPTQPAATTNQIKPSKKKLELTKSQELHPKITLDVHVKKPARKRTVSSCARLENGADWPADSTNQDEDLETHVTLCSKYISDDQGCVHGILLISTSAVLFKPNKLDTLVQEHGSSEYEVLIPLCDISHASITRDVALPRRLPFSSPRRQSVQRIQMLNAVAMDTRDSATPTQKTANAKSFTALLEKSKSDGELKTETEKERSCELSSGREKGSLEVLPTGEKGMIPVIRFKVGSDNVERSPAPTTSDTDAESEWDTETGATPTPLVSDEKVSSEKGGKEEVDGNKTDDEKSEGVSREGERGEEGEEGAEGEAGKGSNEDEDLTGSTVPSNLNSELSGSADDLLAIMGSGEATGEATETRPHAESQCSVMSLDAVLGDTAYFLHLRVVSKSGQKYTYVPVNTEKGVDIPPGVGKKAVSPPVQCIKTMFCFVVPERNLEKVVSFLSLHHPQGSARLGSPSDHKRWTEGYFDVIRGPRLDNEDLSFCDDHFKNPDSWEVYSLTDLHKFRNVIHRMEVEENALLPNMMEESALLTENHLRKLILHLPSQAVGHDMHLVYSTFNHGISLRTMYRNMLAFGDTPVLFVVRDDSDKIFGAMASSYLRLSDHFYGTGESCLFSFDVRGEVELFPWTGLNSYFIKGNTDSIAIGSGDGHFGLWLDENFLHGSSSYCETYGNSPLATTEDFLCTGVEAWGFSSS